MQAGKEAGVQHAVFFLIIKRGLYTYNGSAGLGQLFESVERKEIPQHLEIKKAQDRQVEDAAALKHQDNLVHY